MASTSTDEAFTRFVRESSPSLTRTAWLLTGSRDAAADLVQGALLKALQSWRRIPRGAELAYTRRILVNENIDRWRRRHGEVVVGSDFDRPSPDAMEDRVADRDRVARMLATLPDVQRRIVVLRFHDDLPVSQVAEILGMTEGAVRAACHRALESLRQHYPDPIGDSAWSPTVEGGRS